MYSLLCAGLVRSKGSIANFTRTYKKVASRYQLGQTCSTLKEPLELRDKQQQHESVKTKQTKHNRSLVKLSGPQRSAELLKNSSIKYVIPRSRFSPVYYPFNFIKFSQHVQNFSKKSFLMQTVNKNPSIVQNLNKKATTLTSVKKPTNLAYCINQGKNFATKKFFLNQESLESYKNAMKTVNSIAKMKNPDMQWTESAKKCQPDILDKRLFPLPNEPTKKSTITYPIKYTKHNMKVHKRFNIRDSITKAQVELPDTTKSVNMVKPVKSPKKITNTDLMMRLMKSKKENEELQKQNKIVVKSKTAQKMETSFKPTYKIVKPIVMPAKISLSEILQREATSGRLPRKVVMKKEEVGVAKKQTVSNFIVANESTENKAYEKRQSFREVKKPKKSKKDKNLDEQMPTLEGETTIKHAMQANKEINAVVVDSTVPRAQSFQSEPDSQWIRIHPEIKVAPKELKRKLKSKFMGLLLKKQTLPKIISVKAKLLEPETEKETEVMNEIDVDVSKLDEDKADKNKCENVKEEHEILETKPQIMSEQDENIFNKCFPKDVWAECTTPFEIDKVCVKENTNNYQNVTSLEPVSPQLSKTVDNTDVKTNEIKTTRKQLEEEAKTLTEFVDKLKVLKDKSSVNDVAQFRQLRSKSVDSAPKKSAFATKIEAIMPKSENQENVTRKNASMTNLEQINMRANGLETTKKLLEYKIEQLQLKEQLAEISKKLLDLEIKKSDIMSQSNIIEPKTDNSKKCLTKDSKIFKEPSIPRDKKIIKDINKVKKDVNRNKLEKDPKEEEKDPDVVVVVDQISKQTDQTPKKLSEQHQQSVKKTPKPNHRVLTLTEKLKRSEKVKEQLQKIGVRSTRAPTVRNQTNKTRVKTTPEGFNVKKVDKLNIMAQLNANYADNLRKKEEEMLEIKKLKQQFNSQSSLKSRVPRKDDIKLSRTYKEIESKNENSDKAKQRIDKLEIARKIAAQMKQRNVNVIEKTHGKMKNMEMKTTEKIGEETNTKNPSLSAESRIETRTNNQSDSVVKEKLRIKTALSSGTQELETPKLEDVVKTSAVKTTSKSATEDKANKAKSTQDKEAFYIRKQKEWDRLIKGEPVQISKNVETTKSETSMEKLEKMLDDAERQPPTSDEKPNMFKKILKQYANMVEDKIQEIRTNVTQKSLDKEHVSISETNNRLENKVDNMQKNEIAPPDRVEEMKENIYKKTFDKDNTGGPKVTLEVKVKSKMPQKAENLQNNDPIQQNLQNIVSCPSVAVELLKRKKSVQPEDKNAPINLEINLLSPKDMKVQETIIDNQTNRQLLIDYKTMSAPKETTHDKNNEEFLKLVEPSVKEAQDIDADENPIIEAKTYQVVFCKDTFEKSDSVKPLQSAKITDNSNELESTVVKPIKNSTDNKNSMEQQDVVEPIKLSDATLLHSKPLTNENAELLRELEKISLEFAGSMLKKDTEKDNTEVKESEKESKKDILDKVLAHKSEIIEKNISTLEDLEKVNEFLTKLENLEHRVLLEQSPKDAGNKIRVPTPPKPDPKNEKNIKKEKPKTSKDMVLPPRTKSNERKDVSESGGNDLDQLITNSRSRNSEFMNFEETEQQNATPISSEQVPNQNEIIFMKKQTVSEEIEPFDGEKYDDKLLKGLQSVKLEIKVSDDQNEATRDEKSSRKPPKGPGLAAKEQSAATNTKSFEVQIENSPEPSKTYVEKYLGSSEDTKQNVQQNTIEKYVWEEEPNTEKKISREQLKKTVILVLDPTKLKDNAAEVAPHDSITKDKEFLQDNVSRSTHTYNLLLDLPYSTIRTTKSMSELKHTKSDSFSTGGHTRSLCQKSGPGDETPELQKMKECLKQLESRPSFSWPRKDNKEGGASSDKKQDLSQKSHALFKKIQEICKPEPCKIKEDPCKKKKEDPCKKKEDPCKKKEDPCKKKQDDICPKKYDDFCKKKCNSLENAPALDCPAARPVTPIRAAKSTTEITLQKGNSRTLCQKSGKDDDPPEIRKLKECLKQRESKPSFEWPRKDGKASFSSSPPKQGDSSNKQEDPCKKKEDPCKRKEDPCKKKEDDKCKQEPCKTKEDPCKKKEDPCKKKQDDICPKKYDDFCNKKCNSLENAPVIDCPTTKKAAITEPNQVVNTIKLHDPQFKKSNNDDEKAIFYLTKEDVLILKQANVSNNSRDNIDRNIEISRESDTPKREIVTKFINPNIDKDQSEVVLGKKIVAKINQFLENPKDKDIKYDIDGVERDNKKVDYLYIREKISPNSYIKAKVVNVLNKTEYVKLKESNKLKKFNKNLLSNSKNIPSGSTQHNFQENILKQVDIDGMPTRSTFYKNLEKAENVYLNNRSAVRSISVSVAKFDSNKDKKRPKSMSQIGRSEENKTTSSNKPKIVNMKEEPTKTTFKTATTNKNISQVDLYQKELQTKKDVKSIHRKKQEKKKDAKLDPEHEVITPKDPNISDSCRILGTSSKIHNHQIPELSKHDLYSLKAPKSENDDNKPKTLSDIYNLKLPKLQSRPETTLVQKSKSNMYTLKEPGKTALNEIESVLKEAKEYLSRDTLPEKTHYNIDYEKKLNHEHNKEKTSKSMNYDQDEIDNSQNTLENSHMLSDSLFKTKIQSSTIQKSKTINKNEKTRDVVRKHHHSGLVDDSVIAPKHRFDYTSEDNFKNQAKHSVELELLDGEKHLEIETRSNTKYEHKLDEYPLKDELLSKTKRFGGNNVIQKVLNLQQITDNLENNYSNQLLKKQQQQKKLEELSKNFQRPVENVKLSKIFEENLAAQLVRQQQEKQKFEGLPKGTKRQETYKKEAKISKPSFGIAEFDRVEKRKSRSMYMEQLKNQKIINLNKEKYQYEYKNLKGSKFEPITENEYYTDRDYINKKLEKSNEVLKSQINSKTITDSERKSDKDNYMSKKNEDVENSSNLADEQETKFTKSVQIFDYKKVKLTTPIDKYITDVEEEKHYLMDKAKSEIITMHLDKEVVEKLTKYFEKKRKVPKIENALLQFTTEDPLIEKYLKEQNSTRNRDTRILKSSSDIQKSRKQLTLDSIEQQIKIDNAIEDEIARQVLIKKRNIMKRKKLKKLINAIEEFDEELKRYAKMNTSKQIEGSNFIMECPVQTNYINKKALQLEIDDKILEDRKKKLKRRKNEAKILRKEHRNKKIGLKTNPERQTDLNVASPAYKNKKSLITKHKKDKTEKKAQKDIKRKNTPKVSDLDPEKPVVNKKSISNKARTENTRTSKDETIKPPKNKTPSNSNETSARSEQQVEVDKKLETENLKELEARKIMDKYKHLKVTYMTIIRKSAKEFFKKEDEFEANRKEIMKNLRYKRESEWNAEEKEQIQNYRYQLLQKLNEEWGKQSKNEFNPQKSKLEEPVRFGYGTSKRNRSTDMIDELLSDYYKQQAKISKEKVAKKIRDSEIAKIDKKMNKLAKPVLKNAKSFVTVADYVWSISKENSDKNKTTFRQDNENFGKIKGGDSKNTPKRQFSTFSGVRFCKSADKCNSEKPPDENSSENENPPCERLPKPDCASLKQDTEICEEPEDTCVHPPEKCQKEDVKTCRKQEFDIECEVPQAFECPSPRLRDCRNKDLYYKTHRMTFNDLYVHMSAKRTFNDTDKSKK